MADAVATVEGHVFAMVTLGLLTLIEIVSLPVNVFSLLLLRGDRLEKLYPQESVRVGAAGSCLLGAFYALVYMPACITLLGWHATLDNHPLTCFALSVICVSMSINCVFNMVYMSALFAFTIVRPLHVDAIFTRRRGVIIYVITVYIIPVVVMTAATTAVLLLTDHFWQHHIVCLAFPIYWPPWLLKVATFGFLIPAMFLSFGVSGYVLYVARKQATRTIQIQPDHQPHTVSRNRIMNTGSDVGISGNTSSRPNHSKGARQMCMSTTGFFLILIPAYTVTGIVAMCPDCLPPETAFVVLLLIFGMNTIGQVAYICSKSRAREMLKTSILTCLPHCLQVKINM